MASQEFHSALERARSVRIAWLASALIVLAGCAAETEEEWIAPLNPAVVASPLASCNGGSADPFSEVEAFRVIAFTESEGREKTFDKTFGYAGAESLGVQDVPEGVGVELTVLGYTGADQPQWYARANDLVVSAGSTTDVDVVLSRFGGYSCPTTDTSFTARVFSSTTAIGDGKYFIAGGLTERDGNNFTVGTGSDAAWIYDSTNGQVTSVASKMNFARGAHAAFYVSDVSVSRILLFGGTATVGFIPDDVDGMGWTWADADGLSTVEVYEWVTGTDPTEGVFRSDTGDLKMPVPRVFPNANQISPDGLVMVCGGAPWDRLSPGYEECDVIDTIPVAGGIPSFILSNNNPVEPQLAGAASVVVESDQVTRLLFAGGSRTGNSLQLYTSSTAQKDGVGGAFRGPDGVTLILPNVHFGALAKLDDDRFVLTGGANWNGSAFDPLTSGNAWTLSIFNRSPLQIIIEAVSSFDVGRMFHGVGAPAGTAFTVVGGFSSATSLDVTGSVPFLTDAGFVAPPDTEEAFAPRGGFVSTLLANDSLLLVGGIDSLEDLDGGGAGNLEVYAPSNIPVEQ